MHWIVECLTNILCVHWILRIWWAHLHQPLMIHELLDTKPFFSLFIYLFFSIFKLFSELGFNFSLWSIELLVCTIFWGCFKNFVVQTQFKKITFNCWTSIVNTRASQKNNRSICWWGNPAYDCFSNKQFFWM